MKKTGLSLMPVLVPTANSVQLCGPSPHRWALVLPSGTTNRYTIGFGTAAILDRGLTIYPTNTPFTLSYEDIGDLITQNITAISAVADQTIAAVEVVLAP